MLSIECPQADDERMQALIRLPDGFPVEDIEQLCSLMSNADPFVPAFEPSDHGLYSLAGQVWSLEVEKIDAILIPDRNVASRMAQIARGMTIGKEAQLIAGITAFAHFFDILMEPGIAFHELARREGNEAALQELAWFRAADHGNKFDWLEVALGRAKCLARPGEPRALESHDLAAGLRDWSTGYGAVLKLAEVELRHPGAPIEKIMALLEWMHCDYFFAGQVATMACVYFAPINAPKAGLMKSLRSPNREKAIDGAKNAAWDALYLSALNSMVNKAADSSKRFIYASLDWRARLIARMAMAFGGDGPNRDVMAGMLGEWWTKQDADAIADKLTEIALDIDSPEMAGKRRKAAESKQQTIAAGEQAIRDWFPNHGAKRMFEPQNGRGALFTGGLAAILASACCLGPLVLIALGFSGAWIGNLTVLEPYRPIFIGVALVALFFAWRRIYRPAQACKPGEVCAIPHVQATYKFIFWIVAALVLVALGFPYVIPFFY